MITSVLAASMVACNEPIEVSADLPDRGNLITITGLFGADSAWSIDVTSSKAILDTKAFYGFGEIDLDPITNAKVTIRENSQVHDELVYSPKTFIIESWTYRSSKADIHPVPGKTYDIEVTVPGRGTATATSFVPSPAHLTSVIASTELTTITSHRINGPNKDPVSYRSAPTDIVIDDPAGENFYELIIRYYPVEEHAPMPWWATPVFTKDMRFHNTGLTPGGSVLQTSGDEYYTAIFSDSDPAAKQLKFSMMLPVQTNVDENNVESIRSDIGYQLILRTLSKEYFQYVASQELQAYSYDDPFAQPVVIYGNVRGGLGIFAGFSEDAREVEFR